MIGSTNSNLTQVCVTNFSADFQAKAAKFKAITGREIGIYKNDEGKFINAFHPESTERVSFFVDFFRVGFSSPDGFEAAIRNLAEKYSELREELLERYGESQDELYKQLGELNQAFETALNSTVLFPAGPMPSSAGVVSSSMPQSVRESIKREWREHENINSLLQNLQNSMAGHINTFFETFIKNIQANDFDTAFADTMELMNSGESLSLSQISFRDAVIIRDTLAQGRLEQDEHGNEVFIINNLAASLREIISNPSISGVIRREIADFLGFNVNISAETEAAGLTYAQMLVRGMMGGIGNGNPNDVGSPIQVLNAKLFNIAITFGEISAQSTTNNNALQSALRDLVVSLFDEAAGAMHSENDDAGQSEQIRAEARALANNFLNRFFNVVSSATPQNLQDTGMSKTELAFHEAWNFMYFEVGAAVLGGSDITVGEPQHIGLDGKPIVFQTDAEFHRLMIEELLRVARENAEVYRQWAEMRAEEAERMRKIMLIAAHIASGDNVPPQDREFLMANSPGMYMIANTSRVERENPQDHESVLSEDEQGSLK